MNIILLFLVDPTGNRRWWIIPVTRTRQDQIDIAVRHAESFAAMQDAIA